MSATTSPRGSWICRDDFERARFMDLHARMLPVNTRVFLAIVVVVALCIPTLERPLALIPIAMGFGLFGGVQRHARHFSRPEVAVFWTLLVSEALILLVLVLADVERSSALALLVWPACGVAGRFRTRVTTVGTVYLVVITAATLMVVDPDVIWTSPMEILVVLVAIVAAVTVASTLRDADLESRGAAITDSLTGLLNRHALESRTEELRVVSVRSGEPVAVLAGDLDHFKVINDSFGHAAGDAVLQDVSNVLRSGLRAYDLAYRMGGEEFAIVMPFVTLEVATQAAERLRAAVAAQQCGGQPVTISFGVAASVAGQPFEWDDVFGRADAALYRAKAAGRDRVEVDEQDRATADARAHPEGTITPDRRRS